MKPLCCVSLWLRGLYCVPIQSPLIFASLSPCHCITLLPAHPHIHSVCLPVFPSISPFYSLTHSFSQMQWIGQTNPPVCPSAPSNIVNIWYSVHSPVPEKHTLTLQRMAFQGAVLHHSFMKRVRATQGYKVVLIWLRGSFIWQSVRSFSLGTAHIHCCHSPNSLNRHD